MNTMTAFSDLTESMVAFFLIALPRILGFFTGFPVLGSSLISSLMMRVVSALCLSLMLHPILSDQYGDFTQVEMSYLTTLKEFFIGWLAGFIISLPLWVTLMIGDIVESQRGGMATDNADPFTGIQSSAYGALMTSTLFLCIFIYGPFHQLLQYLYSSYTIWPVDSFFPEFGQRNINGILMFTTTLFDTLVVLAAPLLIMMFMCEFGLALVNRFSPPLNVFILAMPVKSVVSLMVMWVVLSGMIDKLVSFLSPSSILFSLINGIMR